MIKKNQPATLELTIAGDISLAGATTTAVVVKYKKPDGTTGEWATGSLDTDTRVISLTIAANTLDQVGEWRFEGWVAFGSTSYPCTSHVETVYDEMT